MIFDSTFMILNIVYLNNACPTNIDEPISPAYFPEVENKTCDTLNLNLLLLLSLSITKKSYILPALTSEFPND